MMRVHSGPPATGKSTRLLAVLRSALRQRDWSVQLLVPSATMAEHLRNQLAREELVLRKSTVSTLTRFVDQLGLSHPAASPAQLESTIAAVLFERCPAEYLEVAGQPGFHRHLASSVDALALAGVAASQLEGALGDVYGRILRSLDQQKLALRGERLAQTTRLLNHSHLKGIRHVLLDGFFNFSKTEQAFLDKLATLIEVEKTEPTRALLEEPPLRQSRVQLLAAHDQAHEALWIAGQILRLAEEGVELRRIGILLRNPAAYAPLLESTLARLGIPSRSYLGTPLTQHPVIVFHRAFLKAVAAEWDNVEVLSAMRWRHTGLGGNASGDALEQRVRTALPSKSLEMFPQLEAFADWPHQKFLPDETKLQLKKVAGLIEGPAAVEPDLETAWRWHQRASALRSLHEVIDQTADQLDTGTPLLLEAFWQAVESNLADVSLHERDTRRNVVHLMDLFESRQWDLDYVFAPGLGEGEFPQRFSPDPLLTENTKKNFGMKTLEDRQVEEHFLYEMLLTRASRELVMSYPRINSKGDPVLPSALLTLDAVPAPAVTVATPKVEFQEASGQVYQSYRKGNAWSASEFETYLACPWRHFAAKGLELQGLPETPAERLNPLLLGNVAHDTIKIWTQDSTKNIETIGERQLERACREARIPPGYQYERERINLLRNLRLYARSAPPIPPGWQARVEQKFEVELESGPVVRGRIDRYDQAPDGEIHAYDYKYSKATGLDEKYPIQGALYANALGTQVTRFSFIALREQARPAVLEGSTLQNSIALARQMIGEIVADSGVGKIAVAPRNRDNCQYCDFIDACRIRTRAVEEEPAVQVEGSQV
jgi:ATP-dependent helicase/DNAse subunit B